MPPRLASSYGSIGRLDPVGAIQCIESTRLDMGESHGKPIPIWLQMKFSARRTDQLHDGLLHRLHVHRQSACDTRSYFNRDLLRDRVV